LSRWFGYKADKVKLSSAGPLVILDSNVNGNLVEQVEKAVDRIGRLVASLRGCRGSRLAFESERRELIPVNNQSQRLSEHLIDLDQARTCTVAAKSIKRDMIDI